MSRLCCQIGLAINWKSDTKWSKGQTTVDLILNIFLCTLFNLVYGYLLKMEYLILSYIKKIKIYSFSMIYLYWSIYFNILHSFLRHFIVSQFNLSYLVLLVMIIYSFHHSLIPWHHPYLVCTFLYLFKIMA